VSNALSKAIVDKYAADSPLVAALAGRFYFGRAPADFDKESSSNYPYVVFHIISETPLLSFDTTEDIALARVQFSLFTKSTSSVSGGTTELLLEACYHRQALTYSASDFRHMSMTKESSQPIPEDADDIWHYWSDYLVRAQKT